LELVGTHKGIDFYADDLATIPEASWSAILSFEHSKKKLTTLIVGGYDKGLDYSQFAKDLSTTSIETFIYFNPTGFQIVSQINELKARVLEAKSMQEAVQLAYTHTKPDEICLMSTASASFGMFKNATDRGEQYRFWVDNAFEPEKDPSQLC
jgi:UDP-N-acetylmuramoylalanine--D-glutamate ligase